MYPKPSRSRTIRRLRGSVLSGLLIALAALVVGAGTAPLHAQVVGPILEAIRQGGTWVAIPIDGGVGSVETAPIPTMGLRVQGCARVWSGHSGTWELSATDHLADRELNALLSPDESVRFDHQSGPRARLSLDIRWSEPRDTTLMLWVGLARAGGADDDACTPPEASGR